MSTFLQMQTEVLDHGFGTQYSTRIKAWLNQAQQRIARAVDMRELETRTTVNTVNGVATVALPADFVRLQSLVDAAIGRPLDPKSGAEIDAMPAATGRPVFYGLGAEGIRLWPTPDAVYTLTYRYYKDPADMVADADVSTVPADWHDLMVTFALARAYRAEDDAEMANFHMATFEKDLALLAGDRGPAENMDQPRAADLPPRRRVPQTE